MKLETVWDFLRWLLFHPARACCCVFLIVICLLSLRLAGWTISAEKPYIVPSWDSFQQGALADTIKAGAAKKKSYVIESIVMFVRIDGSTSFASGERMCHNRIVYTLRPLNDIIATNGSLFPELYRTTFGTHMRHWPGSEIEVLGSGGGIAEDDKDVEYAVQFSASRGDTYTIVTGSDFDFKLPLKDNRDDRRVILASSQQAVFYENDDDYIAELMIVVESDSAPLKAPKLLRGRLVNNDAPTEEPGAFEHHSDVTGRTTLVGRWQNIRPQDLRGVKFSW